jgi:ribosome-binding factor A
MRHYRRDHGPRRSAHGADVDPTFAEILVAGRGRKHESREPRPDHKTMQLCRQVQRALAIALMDCADDLIREFHVEGVRPAPDASNLLVLLGRRPGYASAAPSIFDVLERLDRLKGWLRREVTRAITRKRAPELSFMITGGQRHE